MKHSLLVLASSVLVLAACNSPDASATLVSPCIDRASFEAVSGYMEVGCGTLDCHGSVARPLMILGELGLRQSSQDYPGGTPTTTDEVDANWHSLCGLQPEVITALSQGEASAPDSLIVQKGRATVHHKGAAVFLEGSAADRCITAWLSGTADNEACSAARQAELPP